MEKVVQAKARSVFLGTVCEGMREAQGCFESAAVIESNRVAFFRTAYLLSQKEKGEKRERFFDEILDEIKGDIEYEVSHDVSIGFSCGVLSLIERNKENIFKLADELSKRVEMGKTALEAAGFSGFKKLKLKMIIKNLNIPYFGDHTKKEDLLEVEKFTGRKLFGMVLRVYANKEEDIPKRTAMTDEAIARGRGIFVAGRKLFKRFDILVWADKRYKEADCGKTADILREHYKDIDDVFIWEVERADLYCGILNYGIAMQSRYGHIDYSVIVSSEAFSYMTDETFFSMVEAARNGALAVGVAINELTQSILEGRLANTFAMWHNISLLTVGGFDLKAGKPHDMVKATYLDGWSDEKKECVRYHLAGVEEVIPLARMANLFGPCVAPVLPEGPGVKQYVVPDPITEYDNWLRHISKMGTKTERQTALLATEGYDITYLKGGIMAK